MKPHTLVLLGIALTACGNDDAGLTDDAGSTAGPSTSSTGGSDSESVDGGSTDGEIPTDPTPILEREPMLTHDCEETRAMASAVGATFGRSEALVTVGSEHFVLRSTETLALASIALDGTLGDEVVLEPEEFTFAAATSVVVGTDVATVWTHNGTTLRYARVDDALGTVVAPRDTGISGEYLSTAAMIPSAAGDGVALFFGESDGTGQSSLRFVTLDADGEPTAEPVEVVDAGQVYGMVPTSAAATADGGYAVAYTLGDYLESEVFFVILEADGTPRFAPRRISSAAGEGLRSTLTGLPRRSLLPVGDDYWVAYMESVSDPDPEVMMGSVVIKLAIVDGEGQGESHLLQAPVEGRNNLWPSFIELDDRVGVMWTSGTIIWICAGCIADNDLEFVLLDPEAVVPASNVATQVHPEPNGIVAPIGEFVGADMLTASSLDFHAITLPATGSLRCEPTG
jgi:hypothetical protein